jgi:hypothetical protein
VRAGPETISKAFLFVGSIIGRQNFRGNCFGKVFFFKKHTGKIVYNRPENRPQIKGNLSALAFFDYYAFFLFVGYCPARPDTNPNRIQGRSITWSIIHLNIAAFLLRHCQQQAWVFGVV